MSNLTAIIGGTGLTEYPDLKITEEREVPTPLGTPSASIVFGELSGRCVVFLARHGDPHNIPPHKVNYRANLLALKKVGVTEIIAINAVGGITQDMDTQALVLPDQVIDYTHGREDTFFDGVFKPLDHVEFSQPYDSNLRKELKSAAEAAGVKLVKQGIYGATQGPRLETIAEVNRMERDGCDLVGMTGMPEAVLAKELNIPYASISLVVNKAAGKSNDTITIAGIRATLTQGMQKVRRVITSYLSYKTID